MMIMLRLLPIALFTALLLALGLKLWSPPQQMPSSPQTGIALPELTLPDAKGNMVTIRRPAPGDHKQTLLISLFASWCVPCHIEHPLLMEIKKRGDIRLVGIAWRNTPQQAEKWLAENGNPYDQVLFDQSGISTPVLGISGVPETFLIDNTGIIRFHYPAPLTEKTVQDSILSHVGE